MRLTHEQIQHYQEQGYVSGPRVLSDDVIERLKARIDDATAGAGGGAVPLILGVQRFACASGLAVRTSPTQAGVADAVQSSWLSGNVDVVGAFDRVRTARFNSPRRLATRVRNATAGSISDSAMSADQQEMDGTTAEGLSPEATELVNTLLTAALALALVTCVHAILI